MRFFLKKKEMHKNTESTSAFFRISKSLHKNIQTQRNYSMRLRICQHDFAIFLIFLKTIKIFLQAIAFQRIMCYNIIII